MDLKIDLSAKKILNEKFTKDVKGYDPEQVDAFLDRIIEDYKAFAQYQKESNAYIESVEGELASLKEERGGFSGKEDALRAQIKSLETENASLKNRLGNIKPGDNPTEENLHLIDRINELEQFLWDHGIDPKTFKKRKE